MKKKALEGSFVKGALWNGFNPNFFDGTRRIPFIYLREEKRRQLENASRMFNGQPSPHFH